MPLIRTVVKKWAPCPLETAWENNQDIEHLEYIHSDTNKLFKLLHAETLEGHGSAYDMAVFRTRRRVGPLTLSTFGFRRVISKYNWHQIEWFPLLQTTTAVNYLLFPSGDFSTEFRIEVVTEIPALLYPLRSLMIRSIHRHHMVQHAQDHPMRARMQLLREKDIPMPYRLLNLSDYERLSSQFREFP